MTPSGEFWMSWIVQVAIAIGTIGAVVVALFGGWLRSHLAPPKLILKLENTSGVKTPISLIDPNDGSARQTDSRWYHIRVSNAKRWSPATQVQVFLLRVEEPDAAGDFKVSWLGEIPLQWRHQPIKPLVRTFGYPEDCDLCSVVKNKWLEIHPIIKPFELKTRRTDACQLIVTLQARGVEADSNQLRIKLAWNGEWSDDASEMARNMVVEEVSTAE